MSFQFSRRYHGKIQAVVFDWAGTTVDYGSCAPARVFVEVLKKKGIEVTVAQAREPMGLEKKMHIQTLLEMEELSSQWRKKFGRAWNENDVEELYQDFIPNQLGCLRAFSQLIPGVLETIQELKRRGLKIGSTTGYNADMIGTVAAEAKNQGFEPDTIVCPTESILGRPHPWMALEVARRFQIYPLEAYIKVGDTVADVEEGLNAGMWTIGVAKTGNELGLSEEEVRTFALQELAPKLTRARRRLSQAGAHYVVDGIGDILPVLDQINARLGAGEKP